MCDVHDVGCPFSKRDGGERRCQGGPSMSLLDHISESQGPGAGGEDRGVRGRWDILGNF